MQKVKITDDEMMTVDDENANNEDNNKISRENKPLDPRAGRVDVYLPQIKFNAKKVAELLKEHKFEKNSTKRGRNMITVLAKQ